MYKIIKNIFNNSLVNRLWMFLFVGVSISACGNFDKVELLKGDRIDVMQSVAEIEADPKLYRIPVRIHNPIDVDNWQQFGGNSNHAIGHVSVSSEMYRSWVKNIGGGNSKDSVLLNPPITSDGILYIVNTKGYIYALNESNGKEVWKKELKLKEEDQQAYSAGLAVEGNVLFVTSGTGEVFGLDKNSGEIIWKRELQIPIRSAPAVSDGRLFVVTYNNALYVLKTQDGSLLWTHNGIEENLAIIGGASPAIADDIVIVPYSSGEIYALQVSDGRYIWHDVLSMNVGADTLSSLVDIEASPIIADGIVYAVNYSGMLTAFEIKNGRRVWERSVSSTQMPWVSGNMLFVVTEEGQLVAVHRGSGLTKWVVDMNEYLTSKEKNNGDMYWSGPILAGGRLVVVSSAGYAIAVDPFKGKIKKVVSFPRGISLPPIASSQSLYFLTNDAKVVSFR